MAKQPRNYKVVAVKPNGDRRIINRVTPTTKFSNGYAVATEEDRFRTAHSIVRAWNEQNGNCGLYPEGTKFHVEELHPQETIPPALSAMTVELMSRGILHQE